MMKSSGQAHRSSQMIFEGSTEFPYVQRLQAPETIGVLKGFLDIR